MMSKSENEPTELGWKGSLLVGCGIGLVVFVLIGFLVYRRGKKIEDDHQQETHFLLMSFLSTYKAKPMPRADGSGSDWTGQRALGEKTLRVDGWGNPLRYRCPGPVHRDGWDLWSCGPNGKDDQGTFDDILIGADAAPISSAMKSQR